MSLPSDLPPAGASPADLSREGRVAGGPVDSAAETIPLLRTIDAAANRAGEGLRVAEDYLRLVLDDAHLTRLAKELRHELHEALQVVPRTERLAARDTRADVGTRIAHAAEAERSELADVAAAGFKRAQQALRTLEEFGKLISPHLAAELEALRYRSYTLERSADVTRESLARMAEVRLYVLVDGGPSPDAFAALVKRLVDARVGALQLRDKNLADRELVQRARLLRRLTAPSGALSIVNDRPDVAAVSHADGVHVGQEELSVKDCRALLGPRALVGVSTHSVQQAEAAVLDGASYIGVGPVFASQTKVFESLSGLDLVEGVSRELRLPAFAIGGISAENLQQVTAAGATRVAVGAAILRAADPAAAARDLLGRLASVPSGERQIEGSRCSS